MAIRPSSKFKGRKRRMALPGEVHAYRIKNAAHILKDFKLPRGTKVVIIPQTEAAEAELQRNPTFARVHTSETSPFSKTGVGEPAAAKAIVSPEAYEPDARARAILRGSDYAKLDLEAAGGAYDVDTVRSLLKNVSRQAVDKKVTEGSLLSIPGPSGRRRFPTIQFNDDGSVVKGLRTVQAALGYTSRWAVLNFLVNGHDLLGDERPIDVLRRGDVDRVLNAAKRIGAQGA